MYFGARLMPNLLTLLVVAKGMLTDGLSVGREIASKVLYSFGIGRRGGR